MDRAIRYLFLVVLVGCTHSNQPKFQFSKRSVQAYVSPSKRWPKKELNVCWLKNTRRFSKFKSNVENYVVSEIHTYTNVRLLGWGECTTAKADILIGHKTGALGQSYVGTDAKTVSPPTMWFDIEALTSKALWKQMHNPDTYYKGVSLHEFYHALGGQHEHERNDGSCLKLKKVGPIGPAIPIGPFDRDSIGNYCRQTDTLTPWDILAIGSLYGFPTGAQVKERLQNVGSSLDARSFLPVSYKEKKPENKRDIVLIAQYALSIYDQLEFLGHSGIYDSTTRDAVAQFQSLSGLQATGHLDIETWNLLTEPLRRDEVLQSESEYNGQFLDHRILDGNSETLNGKTFYVSLEPIPLYQSDRGDSKYIYIVPPNTVFAMVDFNKARAKALVQVPSLGPKAIESVWIEKSGYKKIEPLPIRRDIDIGLRRYAFRQAEHVNTTLTVGDVFSVGQNKDGSWIKVFWHSPFGDVLQMGWIEAIHVTEK